MKALTQDNVPFHLKEHAASVSAARSSDRTAYDAACKARLKELVEPMAPDLRRVILRGQDAGRFLTVAPSTCLLYTSPSPRDLSTSRMPSSA